MYGRNCTTENFILSYTRKYQRWREKITNADSLGQRRPNFKGISFRDERSAKMRVENKQQSRGLTRCFLPLSYSSLKRSKFLKKKKKVFLKKRKVSKEFLTKFFFKVFERLVYIISTFHVVATCRIVNRAPTQMLPKCDRLFRNMFKYYIYPGKCKRHG